MNTARYYYNEFIRVVDYDSKKIHITKYRTIKFFVWGFLWPFYRGTVFSGWFLFNTFVVACIVVGFFFLYCDPSGPPSVGWTYCLNTVPTSIFLFLSSLVSFFLGFFINQTFARWWTLRCSLGTYTGKSQNVINLLRIYMPDNDKENLEIRLLVRRYLIAGLHLIFKCFNNKKDIQDLVDKDIISPDERDIITPLTLSQRYSAFLLWTNIVIRNAALNGRIMETQVALRLATSDITEMRGSAGSIASHIQQQIPFNYVHVLTVITKIHILLTSIYAAGIISAGRYSHSYSTIIFGCLLAIVNQFIYDGLLMIHHELLNPLGDDPNDFCGDGMISGLDGNCGFLAEVDLPPSLQVTRVNVEIEK